MSDVLQGGEPPEKDFKPPSEKNNSSQENPDADKIKPPQIGDKNPEADKENPFKKLQIHVREWKETYEFFGFIAGVAVLLVLVGQYGEMVETTKAMKGQSDIMRRQLEEMKHDSTLDERAWVVPFEMTAEKSATFTNGFYFKLMFKNTGKTPALNVSESHDFAVGISGVPTNDPPIQTNSMLLAPDGISFIKSSVIDAGTVEAIRNGDLPEFIYGKIVYDDIFGKHHWTQFCWSIESDLICRPAAIHNSCDDATGANQN